MELRSAKHLRVQETARAPPSIRARRFLVSLRQCKVAAVALFPVRNKILKARQVLLSFLRCQNAAPALDGVTTWVPAAIRDFE